MKPQIQKMLSGGLNLLTAADSTDPAQAIAAENWRTDQQGVLRSRRGMTLVHEFTGATNVHTIINVQALASRRYFGVDAALYRGFTSIATGFDGNALGVVSFQDRVWVMNQAKQGKDDGTTYNDWALIAPTAAPTFVTPLNAPAVAYGGTGSGSLTGSFEYYVTGYGFSGVVGTVNFSVFRATGADFSASMAGQPITINAVVYTVASVSSANALTLTTSAGTQTLVAYSCATAETNPSILEATGLLNTDSATLNVSALALGAAGYSNWNVYRHDRTLELAGGTPNVTAYLVNTVPIAVGTTTYVDTGAGAQSNASIMLNASIRQGLNGDYTYYVTGETDYAEETNPSPGLFLPTIADGYATIIRPAFTDTQVTGWNIYRTGGIFPLQPYRINVDTIPLATTQYTDAGVTSLTGGDDQSDIGIAELGLQMATNHDPAPPARGLAGPYFNKLLAFNSVAHPNRLWWTPTNEPWFFPGSNSEQDGNWVDIGEEGEAIIAIAVFPRWVAVLKETSFHRLVGDPDTIGADIERTNAEVGQIGTAAWCIAGSQVFGQAEEYIYAFNGDKAVSVSPTLDPVFKEDAVLQAESIPALPIDPTQRSSAVMAYKNGRLYFSYADLGSTVNSHTLVLNVATGKWWSDSRGFSAFFYEGQGGKLLAAAADSVYSIEDGVDDAGTPFPLTYQTRYEDQGAPENRKRYSDILIEHNTSGRIFDVIAYLENGTTVINLGTIYSTVRTQQTFTLDDAENRNISIRLVTATEAGGVAEFFTIALHYIILERNARTYDTEKTSLQKLSLLNALEVDLEILSGQVAYFLYAGIETLALLQSGTFTGTLETFQLRIQDYDNTARWVRLLLSGDDFRCHGARLQIQEIGANLTPAPPMVVVLPVGEGAYTDPLTGNARQATGTLMNSFTWDSGKIALNKLSLLNGIEVGLEITNFNVQGYFYYGIDDLETGIPINYLAAGNVQVFVNQIPDGVTARWVRFVLQGDDWRFHGARLQLQEIGVEQRTMEPAIISLSGGPGASGVFINAFTWDSGKIPLAKLSLLNGLEIGAEILGGSVAGTFTYGITDLATAAVYTFTDLGQVEVFVNQLPDALQARWVRLILVGDNWRFRGARLQLQEIGVEQQTMPPQIQSLSGGESAAGVFINAFTWDSGKIPLENVSLLNAIEISLDILAGTVNYQFLAGLTELDALSTGNLAGTVQAFVEILPLASTARWVRLIVQGDNYRFHGARLQLQQIGANLTPGNPEILSLSGGQGAAGVFVNSRTWDSGKVAMDKVNLLNAIEAELEIVSGVVNFVFECGIFALDTVITGEYQGTLHTFTTALLLVEARWFRFVLTGDNFRCHGARIQTQPIGVYLAGVGDTFRSGNMTLGSPRIKLLQQLRVDCHPEGPIPGSLQTDEPGGFLARYGPTLAPSVDRGWQRFNLPRDTRGRTLRLEFPGAAVCRIYAIQVRAKVLGEDGGTWQWIDLPVDPTPPGFSWMPLPL